MTDTTAGCSASSTSSCSCTLEHPSSSLECSEEENDEDVELGHQANFLTCHSSVKNDDDDEEHGRDGIAVVLQLYKKDEEDITSSSSSFSVDTESAETEYTHVRIPCPGMMQLQRPSSTTTESTTTCATKDDNTVSTNTTPRPRTREVPINCSICLSSYEPHQSICYSSSPQCQHVFHSECIMHWFVEMGRQDDTIVIGHGTKLNESSLLNYTLSCPCCRQAFVQSDILQKGVGKEEKDAMAMDKIENRITNKVTEVEEMEEDEEQESPV